MTLIMDTYLVVLVYSPHPVIALILSYNLSSVFDNNLIRLKSTIGSNPITTISCLDDFDSNIILPTSLAALTKVFKTAIGTMFRSDVTVAVITFIEHESIETVLVAPRESFANTRGVLKTFGLLPELCCISDKHVYNR